MKIGRSGGGGRISVSWRLGRAALGALVRPRRGRRGSKSFAPPSRSDGVRQGIVMRQGAEGKSQGALRRARLVHRWRIMSRSYLCGAAGIGMLAAFFLSGCSSSQMSRIDSNRELYETWPLEMRQAVLDGKADPGMTPDMVLVSWGKPTEVVARSTNAGEDEIWIYRRGGDDGTMMSGGPSMGIGGVSPGIGISTGRGGTSIGTSIGGGIGIGGGGGIGLGGSGIGMGGSGIGLGGGGLGGNSGMGSPIMTQPTPPDIREVVFRSGVVFRADPPFDAKEPK